MLWRQHARSVRTVAVRGMGALRFSGAPVGFGGAVPYLQPPRVVWVGLGIFALMHGMD